MIFEQRLAYLLTALNISAANFAERLKIQRSTLSHLLSGRNKPGFEFMERLLTEFPGVNLEWLISGNGTPLKNDQAANDAQNPPETQHAFFPAESGILRETEKEVHTRPERMILLYADGTFESFDYKA